jgi:hypothetical protein
MSEDMCVLTDLTTQLEAFNWAAPMTSSASVIYDFETELVMVSGWFWKTEI